MKFNTRFGKTIDIPLDRYLTMSDDELAKLEESEGIGYYESSSTYIEDDCESLPDIFEE